MKVKIVGNGIAAFMLAEKLERENVEVNVIGIGPPQSPPQVMVHLFAGRSFRRSKLELDAFKDAVEYWRKSPFSTETKVNRDTNTRLEKSLSKTEEYSWESPILKEGTFSYGPSFVIDAWGLMDHLQNQTNFQEKHIENPDDEDLKNCDRVVWATGLKNNLPYCQLNTGVSIAIDEIQIESQIRIGQGVHHASSPKMSSIGGAFLNTDLASPKSLLLERANPLIRPENAEAFENGNLFQGKKSVSEDRLPVIGTDTNDDFLFTAFGARAFFWLPLASKLAYQLLTGTISDSSFSPRRFKKEKP